jgi:NAD(P)-dependent dehydrogenase (short-subunit alcohol dehydrogenase family)
MGELDGKVAVVTGAAGDIGRATAECLAEHGARLVLADIRADDVAEVAAQLSDAIGVEHDARESASAQELAAKTYEAFGRADILVNNAGVSTRTQPAVQVTDEEWDRVMDINARGVFVVTRAFLPGMLEQRSGRIINVSSIVGQKGAPFVLPYSVSKFAVNGITQALAAEIAAHGITVNSVHPGLLQAGLHDIKSWAEFRGESVEETWDYFLSFVPQGEFQTPQDMAEVIAFIASDRARHITGAAFNIDGGLMMH